MTDGAIEAALWSARAAQDWPGTAALAATLRAAAPDVAAGYRLGLQAARELRDFAGFDRIADAAEARFPDEAWPLVEAVWCAFARGDATAGTALAETLRARFPDIQDRFQVDAWLHGRAQRFDAAEAVLRQAQALFPGETWPHTEHARLAAQHAEREAGTALITALRALPPAPPTRRVIVVLGMHRAGTSLCARLVEQLGIGLGGPLVTPGLDNPDGYQEHAEIVACHEALLASLGAAFDTSWMLKPAPPAFWRLPATRALRDRLLQITARELAAQHGSWAFKDPRTVRFLPLWISIFAELGVAPVWLLAHRHPHAVARSLHQRNGISPEFGELLWVEHYLDALRHLGAEIAGAVDYDGWFNDPDRQIRTLARLIGVTAPERIAAARRCIRGDLRHHAAEAAPAGLARAIHDGLRADTPDFRALRRMAEAVWMGL